MFSIKRFLFGSEGVEVIRGVFHVFPKAEGKRNIISTLPIIVNRQSVVRLSVIRKFLGRLDPLHP